MNTFSKRFYEVKRKIMRRLSKKMPKYIVYKKTEIMKFKKKGKQNG